MKMIKSFIVAFLFLVLSQSAVAQVTTAQIREQIAKGECETAQSLYNVYKAMNGANKTIEQEIADCKTGSSSGFGETDTANGHEYVNLGLPSGTLWATCNVGASRPEDYGSYFSWGETQTNSIYNWETNKYFNGGDDKLTKYCNKSNHGYEGFTDNLTTLQACDDPATVKWGSGWCMPSKAQWEELLANTTNQWTTWNSVKGRLFTSKKNGETIFLPAAGSRHDSRFSGAGSQGCYWSRSLETVNAYTAWYLLFDSGMCEVTAYFRQSGFSVRPVCEKKCTTTTKTVTQTHVVISGDSDEVIRAAKRILNDGK